VKLDVPALLLTGMRWRGDGPKEAAFVVPEVMEPLSRSRDQPPRLEQRLIACLEPLRIRSRDEAPTTRVRIELPRTQVDEAEIDRASGMIDDPHSATIRRETKGSLFAAGQAT
jgi:hypothetical protein